MSRPLQSDYMFATFSTRAMEAYLVAHGWVVSKENMAGLRWKIQRDRHVAEVVDRLTRLLGADPASL